MIISGRNGWPFIKASGLLCSHRVRRGPQLSSAWSCWWWIWLSSLSLQQHGQGHTAPRLCTGSSEATSHYRRSQSGHRSTRQVPSGAAVPGERRCLSRCPVGTLSLGDAALLSDCRGVHHPRASPGQMQSSQVGGLRPTEPCPGEGLVL